MDTRPFENTGGGDVVRASPPQGCGVRPDRADRLVVQVPQAPPPLDAGVDVPHGVDGETHDTGTAVGLFLGHLGDGRVL